MTDVGRARSAVIGCAILVAGWAAAGGLAPPGDGLYAVFAAYSVLVLLVVGLWARGELRGWFRLDARVIAWGLGAALLQILATHATYALAVRAAPELGAMVSKEYVLRGPAGDARRIGLMIVVIAAEEVLWRASFIAALSALGWVRAAPWISLATYVLVQVPLRSPVVVMLAAACGLFWTLERQLAKSAAAPLLTHFLWDITLLALWPVT